MVIEITKDMSEEEVTRLLQQLEQSKSSKKENEQSPKTLADFFGSMKGVFGDPIEYQRKIRDEWE